MVGRAELLSSILYLGALLTYHNCTQYRAKTSKLKIIMGCYEYTF